MIRWIFAIVLVVVATLGTMAYFAVGRAREAAARTDEI